MEKFLSFLQQGVSPFHTVEQSARWLEQAGFTPLALAEAWDLMPGGRYVVRCFDSSLVAFAVGRKAGQPFPRGSGPHGLALPAGEAITGRHKRRLLPPADRAVWRGHLFHMAGSAPDNGGKGVFAREGCHGAREPISVL